ncbi:hypothetical protein JHN63_26390 [Streptomyces sp. MBT65]|uniref:hypothetical protein n=1 Tax=Streptomyces sp. MBT65 TaxID=1488395 RepID=UPI00190DF174|nr:hypothetical protein [Streptomyces sp. MBT65]MBK3577267.1 hypothetical protein [Streptomyces sp. MBT65]
MWTSPAALRAFSGAVSAAADTAPDALLMDRGDAMPADFFDVDRAPGLIGKFLDDIESVGS